MTIASGRINLQSKHDLISHVAKVKGTTSAHSMATKYLFSVFIIPFWIQHSNQKKIYIPQSKEHNICNIVRVFMFQQRLE